MTRPAHGLGVASPRAERLPRNCAGRLRGNAGSIFPGPSPQQPRGGAKPHVNMDSAESEDLLVGVRGLEPRTSSLSGKAQPSESIRNTVSELASPSMSVRRCTPVAVAVVTQLDTQPLG
jgi:hypothetical protein